MLYGSNEHRAKLAALLDDGSDFQAVLAEEFGDGDLVAKCLVFDAIESAEGNAPPPPDASDYNDAELRGLFPVSGN